MKRSSGMLFLFRISRMILMTLTVDFFAFRMGGADHGVSAPQAQHALNTGVASGLVLGIRAAITPRLAILTMPVSLFLFNDPHGHITEIVIKGSRHFITSLLTLD
jgi:hypothetical protein